MKKHLLTTICLTFILAIPLFLLEASEHATQPGTQTYTPLVGIPGVATGNFDQFINTLYFMSIAIAALLAVIKIVIAGVKYMLSDIVTSKESAKQDIKGALIGLLIVMGAVLILTIINPQLTSINFDPDKIAIQTKTTADRINELQNSKVPISSLNLPPFQTVCSAQNCPEKEAACIKAGGIPNIVGKNQGLECDTTDVVQAVVDKNREIELEIRSLEAKASIEANREAVEANSFESVGGL